MSDTNEDPTRFMLWVFWNTKDCESHMTRRFLFYSHDTYGLGHLRRNTTIAEALTAQCEDAEVLLVSGSPRSSSFRLPTRTDVLQLPSVTKSASGTYRPRRLTGDIESVVELRSTVIEAAVGAYRPDVMLVDHAPAGMGGELLPVFAGMADNPLRPRMVLGLRDIIDEPRRVRAEWSRNGVWNLLSRYDDVVVYGDRRVRSTADDLDLQARLGKPIDHVGYAAPAAGPRADSSRRAGNRKPFVVVTVGGGGDGYDLCYRYLKFCVENPGADFHSLVVTGPLMSGRRRKSLARLAALVGSDVEIKTFDPEMRNRLGEADAVVAMAGYNTVVELLAAGTPALLVPRSEPRLEQTLRAKRLSQVSHLEWCRANDLTSARLGAFVRSATGSPRQSCSLDLGGAGNLARLLLRVVPVEAVASHG